MDQGAGAPQAPGGTAGVAPEEWRDWAGLPEHLLMKVAGALVSQDEAGLAAEIKEKAHSLGLSEMQIQAELARQKRWGNCLFVFALVCKRWRKAQLKVGGPLCSRVHSDVAMPGSVALAKWALAEGCPRESEDAEVTLASAAAFHGNLELVKWLCGEGGFSMDDYVMWSAAGSGNLELVRWLRTEGCPWDHWMCYHAIDKGHLGVLRWARENGCPMRAVDWDKAAAELGYTDNLGNLVNDWGHPVDEDEDWDS